MPKIKLKSHQQLNEFVSTYGKNVFVVTDDNKLYCKLCKTDISGKKSFNIQYHINTKKHESNRKAAEMELEETQHDETSTTFHYELCEALIASNIPLSKLNNAKLRHFVEKYTKRSIPSESTLRKYYVSRCYDSTINTMKMELQDKKLWVSIDETTDSVGRHVTNVIVGTMDIEKPGKPYLLTSESLEAVNYLTISKVFNEALKILWPYNIRYENILLFVTDAAPYMVKAAKYLKDMYKNMVHITCLAHGCHRIAEEIRAQFPYVDNMIANVKKIFVKAPARVHEFKKQCPEISLPPAPILTRWGSWLEACTYYSRNFDEVKKVVNSFVDDSVAIKQSKSLFNEQCIKEQLTYIHSNFGFLPASIAALEKSGSELTHQISVMKSIVNKLKNVNDNIGKLVFKKSEDVLRKNPGYSILCTIADTTTDYSVDAEPSDTGYFKYAPLVSTDVERTFSMFKTLLADNRKSFSFDNLRKILIVYCNAAS